ncbi:crossover junction endodeoxyribonuclease RuvC [bacterium]|nr:crossover junction endodeoxyribonuclease RuvC [bacterium]
MRILGLDPGFDRCGYSVLERPERPRGNELGRLLDCGTLQTSRADSFPQRLSALARGLETLLALWQPQQVAVEELFFAKNAKTAMGVAQARGVLIERCASAGLSVVEYAPTSVKSQLTGSGRADKEQVAFMVRRLVGAQLEERKRLDDELDAIAVALCHSMRISIPAALLRQGSGAAL